MEPDELKADYIAKMGNDLGSQFHVLSSDLTWVHWRWQQYRILFGEKPSRIDLLNETASFFFYVVQGVFFEDTLLGIAKLIGPEESSGKQNLTVRRLPSLCKPEIQTEVSGLVDIARSKSAFAIEWRNKYIAHHDLDLALGRKSYLLPTASREAVEHCLAALRDVLNRVEGEYCKADTMYFSPNPWDAKALLYIVREGLRREREKREAWNRGERHAADLEPPEEILNAEVRVGRNHLFSPLIRRSKSGSSLHAFARPRRTGILPQLRAVVFRRG